MLVDHRELRSGVPAALESLGVSVRRVTLRAGDHAVGTQTRIERKTVRDLRESVATGRFWLQLNRLRAVSAFPVVLVEGRDLDAGVLTRHGIRGVVVALVDRGVQVLRAADATDSAHWIRSLARSRSRGKRMQLQAPYTRPRGRRDPPAVAMLTAIPSTSLANARDLIDAFGSLRRIANAKPAELSVVRGVGQRRSQTVYEAVNHLF